MKDLLALMKIVFMFYMKRNENGYFYLNFRYVTRQEPTGSWGIKKGEFFTGMMGQLQREEADFSTASGPTPERQEKLQPIRAYPADSMRIVSLKPSPLPHNTALIRPFSSM